MKNSFLITLLIILASFSNKANSQSLAWAKQMAGAGNGQALSITLDANRNVYTTGTFSGTTDFDPGAGVYNLAAFSTNGDLFVSKLDSSGNFLWAKQMGGASFTCNAYAIAVDSIGNVYTTGFFSGTIDFDPGAGTYNLMAPGAYAVYVSKLDSSGNFVWAKQFVAGNGNTDYGYSITLDDNGNVYSTGQFMSTCDFDPGPGVYNLTAAGNNDCFISKLDASGNFVWAKKMGGTASDISLSIKLDNSGNVYTTGVFTGTADFDPGTGTFNLSSSSAIDVDIFVSKLDNSGNFAWAKRMGGISIDNGYSIAIDAGGNVYTTGAFMYTADFDPGPGIYSLSSIANQYDIYVSKLDSSGNFIWAKQMGGAVADFGYSIAVDGQGNAYTTGYFNSATADFDPDTSATYNLNSWGGQDVFISKLDSSGDFIWAGHLGGTDHDVGYGIATDVNGNIYAAGGFRSTADFDPGTGTYYLTCPSFPPNTFVVKLSDFSTGMEEGNHLFNAFTIYPNPSNGQFNIVSSWNIDEIKIFNFIGQIIHQTEPNENNISLMLDKEGIYCIQIILGGETITKKVIVRK